MIEDVLVADTHFAHYNIALHGSRMPWIYPNPNYNPEEDYHFKKNNPWAVDIKMHDEALIENWNKIVGRKDHVRILGDFAYNYHKKFIYALNGKKTLMKGNHDKMNADSYSRFEDVIDMSDLNGVREECSKLLKRHNKIPKEELVDGLVMAVWNKFVDYHGVDCIDNMNKECYQAFQGVYELGARKKIQGQDVTLSHYAMKTWASSVHGSWMLYGHSHGRLPEFDNMYSFDVGVDVWGYAPVPWLVIVEKMRIIKEKIEARGGRYVDGEHAAKAQYSKDPDQRMLDTRKKNKVIMESLGYEINEEMWPKEKICLPT